MALSAGDRRQRLRTQRILRQQLKLSFSSSSGGTEMVPAKLLDVNYVGWGIEAAQSLSVGALVSLTGVALQKDTPGESSVRACVVWCERKGLVYRIGLSRVEGQAGARIPEPDKAIATVDYYEILQLSPNADLETVHRVYRLLAQRYHPDNQETGDQELFRAVLEAYHVLGDAERRAAYDVDHAAMHRLRWKIFDQAKAGKGVEAEKRKRRGVLGLLYNKRLHEPDKPAMGLPELEDLLGVPREHLEFSLWYLREHAMVVRSDNGRFAITVKGIDEVEKDSPEARIASDRLLPEPAPVSPAAA